jgi:hypothetical protein
VDAVIGFTEQLLRWLFSVMLFLYIFQLFPEDKLMLNIEESQQKKKKSSEWEGVNWIPVWEGRGSDVVQHNGLSSGNCEDPGRGGGSFEAEQQGTDPLDNRTDCLPHAIPSELAGHTSRQPIMRRCINEWIWHSDSDTANPGVEMAYSRAREWLKWEALSSNPSTTKKNLTGKCPIRGSQSCLFITTLGGLKHWEPSLQILGQSMWTTASVIGQKYPGDSA